ncbi:hypothetical protein AVEN_217236-1, partial [Araneus ventricosus]
GIPQWLDDIKIALCALPDDVDLKDFSEITVDMEEEVQEMKASLFVFLSKYDKESEAVNTISKSNIKLPDPPLPNFRGKFQEFELFKV